MKNVLNAFHLWTTLNRTEGAYTWDKKDPNRDYMGEVEQFMKAENEDMKELYHPTKFDDIRTTPFVVNTKKFDWRPEEQEIEIEEEKVVATKGTNNKSKYRPKSGKSKLKLTKYKTYKGMKAGSSRLN